MAAEDLDRSLETAVSQSLTEQKPEPEPDPVAQYRVRAATFPSKRPTLNEQYEIYEKCGVELRRRLIEERSAMVAAYDRQVAAFQEEARQRLAEMKSDLDHKLRENELLSRRLLS